jgi:hypothetical protein
MVGSLNRTMKSLQRVASPVVTVTTLASDPST